jgi:hypothetical protein
MATLLKMMHLALQLVKIEEVAFLEFSLFVLELQMLVAMTSRFQVKMRRNVNLN